MISFYIIYHHKHLSYFLDKHKYLYWVNELESICQNIAQKSRLHTLSLLLMLLQSNQDYLILRSKCIPDSVTDLPCHVSPWLHIPPKRVMSFYLFVSMDHLNAALLHCRRWVTIFYPGADLLSLLPSVPRELILSLLNRNVRNSLCPMWDVLKRPHQRSLCLTPQWEDIRSGVVLGDTNRGDALGCTVENFLSFCLLWMLVSNGEKRLSWLGFCVLFVYLCCDDVKGGYCEQLLLQGWIIIRFGHHLILHSGW